MKYTETEAWKSYIDLMQQRPQLFLPSEDLAIVTDPALVEDYVVRTGRKLGLVYKSPWNMMVVDLVQNRKGEIFSYDRLIATSTGTPVVTVPVYKGRLILIKQYRHAIRRTQYAFPRGFGEDGLSAEENARKELREEIGASFGQEAEIRLLGQVTADSGVTSTGIAVVYCEISSYEERVGYEEIQETILLTREELDDWIKQGRIDDGFTLAAYSVFALSSGL